MFRVIKEGNYTNSPKGFGFLMKNCNTLPLSRNKETMKKFMSSTNELLQEGHCVLIYPEEAMWWNYRKPRPLQNGAYRFAVKNNVPVIPIFITMEDSGIVGPDGYPVQYYTIHISEPIYSPNKQALHENIDIMKRQNYAVWKKIYEETYEQKLVYTIDAKCVDGLSQDVVAFFEKSKIES